MPDHVLSKDFARLSKHFARQLALYGDSARGVQWRDTASQERRMAILAELAPLRQCKVLDFGCGTGHFLSYLLRNTRFEGEFVGYDITKEMLGLARSKFPGVRFEQRDILSLGIPESFDYAFVNGVFNNALSDNWSFMTNALKILWGSCRRGLAFNCLSSHACGKAEYLAYFVPERVLEFCQQELSPATRLRHDYAVRGGEGAWEMTLYIYALAEEPKPDKFTMDCRSSAL